MLAEIARHRVPAVGAKIAARAVLFDAFHKQHAVDAFGSARTCDRILARHKRAVARLHIAPRSTCLAPWRVNVVLDQLKRQERPTNNLLVRQIVVEVNVVIIINPLCPLVHRGLHEPRAGSVRAQKQTQRPARRTGTARSSTAIMARRAAARR